MLAGIQHGVPSCAEAFDLFGTSELLGALVGRTGAPAQMPRGWVRFADAPFGIVGMPFGQSMETVAQNPPCLQSALRSCSTRDNWKKVSPLVLAE